jgi:hypothetical protein
MTATQERLLRRMARIQFDYRWTDDRRALWFSARDEWTWRDYHAAMQAGQFAAMNATPPAHVVVDVSTGTRAKLPAGFSGHMHTFNKRHHDGFSGKAIVIGVTADVLASLRLGEAREVVNEHGVIRFVDTAQEAEALLASWD